MQPHSSTAPPTEIATRLTLLRAILADSLGDLQGSAALTSLSPEDVRWLAEQGVAAYVYLRLRNSPHLDKLGEGPRQALKRAYSHAAVREALQYQEATATVLAALHAAGVETVLMKGMALACTVYPDPRARLKGDLDIWLLREQLADAIAALGKVGYRPRNKESRPLALKWLYDGEQQMVSDTPGTGTVELQWPAIRGEWVRRAADVDHAAIWERRVPLLVEGQPTHVMAPEDQLIHLCIHQAINHQFGLFWLRALLDVHVLIERRALDWAELVSRARSWRVATVVWTVLHLAGTLLGTAVPSEAMQALAPPQWKRRAIVRLDLERSTLNMQVGTYHPARFLLLLLMVDRLQDGARLLWRGVFPEADWLQARYQTQSLGELWRARLLHPLRVLLTARA